MASRTNAPRKPKSASNSKSKAGKGAATPQRKARKTKVKDGEIVPTGRKDARAKAARGKAAKKAAQKGAPKKGAPKKKSTKTPKRVFTAKTADRHELYQLAVQSPKEDVAFLTRVYKKVRKKVPLHFREDFCGTGYLSAHWIKRGSQYTAEGFDNDPDVVGWGVENNFAELGEDAERCCLHIKDVREPSNQPPDVRCAQNFSYFVFKQRTELLEYLRAAYEDLAEDGVFVMDIYGGPESMEEMEEVRDIEEGFTYVWDQDEYWPANGNYRCFIHFRFKDGTELRRAFRYDWRLWTLLELKEALEEVGFETVDSYWEGTDEDGESGNGIFRKSNKGENCMSWITYLVAYK